MKRILFYLTKQRLIIGAAVLAVVAVGWYVFGTDSGSAEETIVVQPKEFVQQVAVSGKVVAARDVDLGFSAAGRISRVSVTVGDRVSQGSVLAEVENADLRAGVLQQQALLAERQAKLESLQAGAQPEDIAASQAALDKAQQDLDNLYQAIADTAQDAYAKANDATRTQLNGFFSNPESSSPQLNFTSSNSQAVTNSQTARVAASAALNAWYAEVSASRTDAASLELLLTSSLSRLVVVRDMLAAVSAVLDGASSLSDATRATYRASVAAAQEEVNAAIKNLNTASQSIASQKLTVSQARAQLNLKRAGATAQELAAQRALVQQAQAAVQNAQAQLQKTLIVAPFSGTVTVVDAKVGKIVSPNTPEISMISGGTFQIESYVPEINVALIASGDAAKVTLDAYGDHTPFAASVASVDPAETVRDGVSTYRALLQFAQSDDRIKAGMTANVVITTDIKPSALAVPQGLVIHRNGSSFVRVLVGEAIEERAVVLGGVSSLGEVEVLSGLSPGDTVIATLP